MMSGWMVLHSWASQITSISPFAFFTCLGKLQLRGTHPHQSFSMSFWLLEFKMRRKLAGRSEIPPSVDEWPRNNPEHSFRLSQMIGFYRLLIAFRATLPTSRRAKHRENCLISNPGHVWWRLLSGRVDLAASSSHILSHQGHNQDPKIQFSSMGATSPAKVYQHAPSRLSSGVLPHVAPCCPTVCYHCCFHFSKRVCLLAATLYHGVFTCPELNFKLFWSFIQSKQGILEWFTPRDPITCHHFTDSPLRISPNSWTALRTVWDRDVVLRIAMPLKRHGEASLVIPRMCRGCAVWCWT